MAEPQTNQSSAAQEIAKQIGLSGNFNQNIQKLNSIVSGNGGAQFGHNELAILANEFIKNPSLASKYGFTKQTASRLLGWSMRIRKDNEKTYSGNIGAGGFLYGSPKEASESKKARRKFVSGKLKDIEYARFGPGGSETIPGQIGDFFKGAGSGIFAAENMLNAEQAGIPSKPFVPRDYSPTSELGYQFGAGLSDTLPSHVGGLAGGSIAGTAAANVAEAAMSLLPQTRVLRGIGIGVKALAPVVGGFFGAGKGSEAVQPFTPFGKLSEAGQQEYLSQTQGPGRRLGETAAFLSTASPLSRDAFGKPTFFSGGLRNAIGALRSGAPITSPAVLPPFIDIGNRAFLASHSISTADASNKVIRENFIKANGYEPSESELEMIPGYQTSRDKLATAAGLALLGHMNPLGNIATGHAFRELGSALVQPKSVKSTISRTQVGSDLIPNRDQVPETFPTPEGFLGDPNLLRMDIRGRKPVEGEPSEPTRTVFWNPETLESRFGEKRGITPDFVRKHNEWFSSAKENISAQSESGTNVKIIGMSSDGEYFVAYDNGKNRAIDAIPYRELPEPLKAVAEVARQKSVVDRSVVSQEEITGRVREYNPESDSNENFGEYYKYKIPFVKMVDGKPKLVEVFAHVESIDKRGSVAKVLLPSGNRMEVPIEFVKDISGKGVVESEFRYPAKSPNVYRYVDFSGERRTSNGLLIPSKDPIKTDKRLMQGVDLTPDETRSRYIGRSEDEFTFEPGTLVDLGVLRQMEREEVNVDTKTVKQHIGIVLGVDTVNINGETGMGYRIRMITDPTTHEFLAAPEFISKATKTDIENAQSTVRLESVKRRRVLEEENKKNSEEIEKLNASIKDLQDQLDSAKGKPSADPEEIKKLQSDIDDLQKNIDSKSDEIKNNNETISIAQKRIAELEAKLEGQTEKDPELLKEKRTLKAQVTRLTKKSEEADKQISSQQEEINRLNDLIKNQSGIDESTANELRNKLSAFEDKVKELEDLIASREQEIESLKKSTSATGTGDGTGDGEGFSSKGSQQKPPSEVEFPYGAEYGKPIEDEFLPDELKTATRGEKFRFFAQTLGDELDRQGNIENVPSAFRTLLKKISGNVRFREVEVSFEGVQNATELELKLQKEFGQTEAQAKVLARWVDANATGWAHEVARLSGINTKLRIMALRTPEEMNRNIEFDEKDAWKAIYREQVITAPAEEIRKLLADLKQHWYTNRFGAIVTLSPEQFTAMGIDHRNLPGFTQSFGQDGQQTVNIAFAMRGAKDYGVHVHEVNHLITRAMYAPMYHELVGTIYPALNSQNTTFSRRGKAPVNVNGVTVNAGQLVEIPRFVEEQIVTALTRQLWEAGADTQVRPLKEMFKEGGAVHDSVMSRLWHDVGQQLRDAAEMPGAPKATDLNEMTGWAVRFDRETPYKIGTPFIYTDPSTGDRIQYRLNENARLGKDGKITTINVTDENGNKESFSINDNNVDPETGQWRVGQMNTSISDDVRDMHILGSKPSKVLAKFLGHYLDHTNEMLKKYSQEYEVKPIEVVFTSKDVIRRTTGTQWWANADEYNQRRKENNLRGLDTRRVRGRTSRSYLGWLDIGDVNGRSGYDVFLPYETILELEKRQAKESEEIFQDTDTEGVKPPAEIVDSSEEDPNAEDLADLFGISSEPKQSQSELNNFPLLNKELENLSRLTEAEYFSEVRRVGYNTPSRPYINLIQKILDGSVGDKTYNNIILSALREQLSRNSELRQKITYNLRNEYKGVFDEYAFAGLQQLFRNIAPSEGKFIAFVKTENGIVRKLITKEELWNEIKSTIKNNIKLAANNISIEERGATATRSNPYYYYDMFYNYDKGIVELLKDNPSSKIDAGTFHTGEKLIVDLSRDTEIARRFVFNKAWIELNSRYSTVDTFIKLKDFDFDNLSKEQKEDLVDFGLTKEAIDWFKAHDISALSTNEIAFAPELRGIPAMSLYMHEREGQISYDSKDGWKIANIRRSQFSPVIESNQKEKIQKAFEESVPDTVSLSDEGIEEPVDVSVVMRPERIIDFVRRQDTSENVVGNLIDGLDSVDFNRSEFNWAYEESRKATPESAVIGIPEFFNVEGSTINWRSYSFRDAETIFIPGAAYQKPEISKSWEQFKSSIKRFVDSSILKSKEVFDLYKSISEDDFYGKYDKSEQAKSLIRLLDDVNNGRIDFSLFSSSESNKPAKIVMDILLRTGKLPTNIDASSIIERANALKSQLKNLMEFDPAKIQIEVDKIDAEIAKNAAAKRRLSRRASQETKALYDSTEAELVARRKDITQKINNKERWEKTIQELRNLSDDTKFHEKKSMEFMVKVASEYESTIKKLNQLDFDIDAVNTAKDLAAKGDIPPGDYEKTLSALKKEKLKIENIKKSLEKYYIPETIDVTINELTTRLRGMVEGEDKEKVKTDIAALQARKNDLKTLAIKDYKLTSGEKAELVGLKKKLSEAEQKAKAGIEHPDLTRQRQIDIQKLKTLIASMEERAKKHTDITLLAEKNGVDVNALQDARMRIQDMFRASSEDAVLLLNQMKALSRAGKTPMSDSDFIDGIIGLGRSYAYQNQITQRAKQASMYRKTPSYFEFMGKLNQQEANWLENYFWIRQSRRSISPEVDFDVTVGNSNKDVASRLMRVGDAEFKKIAAAALQKMNDFEKSKRVPIIAKLHSQGSRVDAAIDFLIQFSKDGAGLGTPKWIEQLKSSHYMSDVEMATYALASLDKAFIDNFKYSNSDVARNFKINDDSIRLKAIAKLQEILGDTENYMANEATELIRQVRKTLVDISVLPYDFKSARKAFAGKKITTKTEADFDRSSEIHLKLKSRFAKGVLDIVDNDKPLTYASLIKALEQTKATKFVSGGKLIILSDTEIANLISMSSREKYSDSKGPENISVARFIELTKSRDEYLKNPLSERLRSEHKLLTGMTIENINNILNTDPQFSDWSAYDKIGALGVLGRVISDERNPVTKFIRYTGQLPTTADLNALAAATKTDIRLLERQLEGLSTVLKNISVESFASGMTGTQIEISSGRENSALSFFTYGLSKSPNEMFIDQADAQSQIVTQVDTLFEKSIEDALRSDKPIPKDKLNSLKEKLSSIYLPDVVFGMPYRQASKGVVIPKVPAPSSKQTRFTPKADREATGYSYQFAEHVKKTTVHTVRRTLELLFSTHEGLEKGKGAFLFANKGDRLSVVANNINAILGGSKRQREVFGIGLKRLADAIAKQIITQRMEIINALENHEFDSYVYEHNQETGLVNVYDYAVSKTDVIYTIDYANARVRNKDGNIILAKDAAKETINIEGDSYPVTEAHKIMSGILTTSGIDRNTALKIVVLGSNNLKSVPAVYYHGIERVNINIDKTHPEPMFLSSEKRPDEIINTAGAINNETQNAYVLPVIRSWKARGRISVNDSGMPFYDGRGYTVQDGRGFRSGIFANLRGAGFSMDKALELYSLTEHPLFRNWMRGDLIETPKMANASSYLDQKRVLNPDTYFKALNGMRAFDAIYALDQYAKDPSDENFDNFKFAFEQIKEIHLGFGDDYKTFDEMFDKIKSSKDRDIRLESYRPIIQSFMDKYYTNNTRSVIGPYIDKVMAQVEIKTGKPFTALAFTNLDPNMYSIKGNGVKSFDLASGLYVNANRKNDPSFIRFSNPFVIDGHNSTVDVFEFKKAFETAIRNGHDGIVLLNIRDDMNAVTRKTLAFTLDDSNVLGIGDMTYPKTEGLKAQEKDIEPMFISSIPANFTLTNIPAATGMKTVPVAPTTKEKVLSFAEGVYDNLQDLTRFSLSQDIAVTSIQGGKAMIGSILPFSKVSGRQKDSVIALHALAKSMIGMAPNLRIEMTLPDGSQIPIGWDKLGRRQYMLMYKSMSSDPFFKVLRDSDAPLHFIGLERKVERERMRRYHAAGGKLKYTDIQVDLMDFDEQGNLPDFYERKTVLSHLPMRGMHERQMSLQHDLLMFGLLKNQYELNPMFNKLTPDQLSKDVVWNSFVKFIGLSQGDLRFSSNDVQDMQRGRVAKFFFQAPRWFLGNIIANPLVNVTLWHAYQHSPALRKKLGQNPQAIWYRPEILQNKQIAAYIAHDTLGTMLTMSLAPVFWQIMGQILHRDDISKTKGNITGWRLGDWTFSESTGTMDLAQWALRLNDAMDAGSYKSTGKYGMSQEDYNQQQMLRWSNVILYKSSPLISKSIAAFTGVDFLGRPSWARNEAVHRMYSENMNMINNVLKIFPEGEIPELPLESNFMTQFGLSYLNDYAEAYDKARKFRTSDPAVANLIAAQQMIASYIGLRTRYEPFLSEEFRKENRKELFQQYQERTQPVEFDWSFKTVLKGK